MSYHEQSDGFVAKHVGLIQLISRAYQLRPDLIYNLPDSLGGKTFDISAKLLNRTPAELSSITLDEKSLMLRQLLSDRFGLTAHLATKLLPAYDLMVVKNQKNFLLAAKPKTGGRTADSGEIAGASSTTSLHETTTTFTNVTLDGLSGFIATDVQRSVFNKTGIQGTYDFKLSYLPHAELTAGDPSTDNQAPSIFTALREQLGLMLKPVKGPSVTLLIDRVSEPSPN